MVTFIFLTRSKLVKEKTFRVLKGEISQVIKDSYKLNPIFPSVVL